MDEIEVMKNEVEMKEEKAEQVETVEKKENLETKEATEGEVETQAGGLSPKQQAEREVGLTLERKAETMMEVHRFDEAHEFFRRAIHIYKKINSWEDQGRAFFRQGFCYEQQQKMNESAQSYKESREVYRKLDDKEHFGSSSDRLAKVLYWQGKTLDAISEYEKAVEFGAENGETLNNLAFLQIEMEKFDEAKKNLEKSLEIREKEDSPETHITYNNLGVVEFINGNFREATELFETGIERDLRPPEEDRSIQYAVFAKPEYKGEKFTTFRVFQDVNTKACLILNLAAARLSSGEEETVMSLLEEALDMDSERPYLYEAAGWIHLNTGDEKRALNYFKRAIPYDPTNEELRAVAHLINPYIDAKVGRNEPCPCGSGKKFKKCHGASV